MSLSGNDMCDKCNVRVPKNRPKLVCSHCKLAKHYKCQNLSRNDAHTIIVSNSTYQWTCGECFAGILPINACTVTRSKTPTTNSFKAKCQCCGGMSYNSKNVDTCPWCDQLCHIKCINSKLGCNTCCDDMIPGFRVHNYELFAGIEHKNDFVFNPTYWLKGFTRQ